MNNLSSHLSRALASAVVTAAALSSPAFAATCVGAKCGPKNVATAASGACSAKMCGAKKHKGTAKCGAKCGAPPRAAPHDPS